MPPRRPSKKRPKEAVRRVRPIARHIGKRIQTLREQAGITQEKLAWESGLNNKGYLSRIEAGTRLPSIEVLERLASGLGVEAGDLLVFPDRSTVDKAIDAVRAGGDEAARRVLSLLSKGRDVGTLGASVARQTARDGNE